MPLQIFVPRWMNRAITNAQSLNAKAMLSRFRDPRAEWTAMGNAEPPEEVSRNGIRMVKLSKSRRWELDLTLAYQSKWDAIFYPGVEWPDEAGLKIRSLCRRHIPLIATIEAIGADTEGVKKISEVLGHAVFSQTARKRIIDRVKWICCEADHIIAIVQLFAKLVRPSTATRFPISAWSGHRLFHNAGRKEPQRCRVVSCGTVYGEKRPQFFLS